MSKCIVCDKLVVHAEELECGLSDVFEQVEYCGEDSLTEKEELVYYKKCHVNCMQYLI